MRILRLDDRDMMEFDDASERAEVSRQLCELNKLGAGARMDSGLAFGLPSRVVIVEMVGPKRRGDAKRSTALPNGRAAPASGPALRPPVGVDR